MGDVRGGFKMKNNIYSQGILVYDCYYPDKPKTFLLIIKKILLCCFISVCVMMFILTEYGLPLNLGLMASVCVVFTAAFSFIFLFINKFAGFFAVILCMGAAVYFNWEIFASRIKYFIDAFMLLAEGRFIFPRRFLLHPEELLNVNNPEYISGVEFGGFILCAGFSLLCALCIIGRMNVLPIVSVSVILCVPRILSETLEVNEWFIPALSGIAAAFAIEKCYTDGMVIKHGGIRGYKNIVRKEEYRDISAIKTYSFSRRIEMKSNYFSKFFSVGMYCAALCAVSLGIGELIFGDMKFIDYSPVYEFISNIGKNAAVSTPFEEGPVSQYFTRPVQGGGNTLNIVSPGTGDREIIRVSFTGDRPVYLRGDIGVDFNRNSWTTPAGSDLTEWTESGLEKNYRPSELKAIEALLWASGINDDIITSSQLSIEYLCPTDVVFLPAYTGEFSYYSSDNFEVYGDFTVRVKESAGDYVNIVQCEALVPSYVNTNSEDDNGDDIDLIVLNIINSGLSMDDVYTAVFPEIDQESNVITEYEKYVNNTYTGVPEYIEYDLNRFISENAELSGKLTEISRLYPSDDDLYGSLYRYYTAKCIADYLRNNYEYTLNGENIGVNPVMEFLEVTKRGHCSLYASAMTLMLRELGIPARYCTGFYVAPEYGADGGTVTLRERNLHAWVEVYLGEIGWATFDPTSASGIYEDQFADETIQAPVPPESSRLPETRPQQPLVSEQHNSGSSSSSSENNSSESYGEENINFDFRILILPAVLFAAVILIIIIRLKYSALKDHADNFIRAASHTNEITSQELYRIVLELCEICGLVPKKGELPKQFFERADKQFGSDLSGIPTLLSAEFGGRELPAADREALADNLKSIYQNAYNKASLPDKLKILRILAKRQ